MAKLNIRLNTKSDQPKSQQIAAEIERAITSGRLKADDALPSERALGEQLGVDRKTVRRAFVILSDRRIVKTYGTRGRRVTGASGAKTIGSSKTKSSSADSAGQKKSSPAKKSSKKK